MTPDIRDLLILVESFKRQERERRKVAGASAYLATTFGLECRPLEALKEQQESDRDAEARWITARVDYLNAHKG